MVKSRKEKIIEFGRDLGFQQVAVASLAPMPEALQVYEDWLAKGYAASMDYLKRDPRRRTEPLQTFPEAKSVLIVSVSYFSEPPPPPPHICFGRVARYAVGLDYHVVIRAKLRELCSRIENELGIKVARRAVTDDAALYEQALAARHGLGFIGKNSLLIGPEMAGSYNLLGELFLDIELEPDFPYQGTCGKCFRCGSACPTDAIKSGAVVDSNACISFLTIENKMGIELALRDKLGDWVFGCDICQEVCPYNKKAQPSPWPEFSPARGVGHYLDLIDILTIADQETFHKRFETSPVRRPKRRGLLRNALVVMGNKLAQNDPLASLIVDAIEGFVAREMAGNADGMLLEHAAWALSRVSGGTGENVGVAGTAGTGRFSGASGKRARGIIETILPGLDAANLEVASAYV